MNKRRSARPVKTSKVKSIKRGKKSSKATLRKRISARRIFLKEAVLPSSNGVFHKEKETVEAAKFTPIQEAPLRQSFTEEPSYKLPLRYGDNRIVLLPRDPWWVHTYWDIASSRIDGVVSSVPTEERQGLRWVLRVYDVSGIENFTGNNAHSFFDIDISFDAGNWYINVNQPDRAWCVDIGLRSSSGKFFLVARSNIIKTPCFGISDVIDEEWALPDEDYFKMLGVYDLGKSSLEVKRRFEEYLKQQISSPISSWGSGKHPRK